MSTHAIPGDVPEGHPGLTLRVLAALAEAKRTYRLRRHYGTDADGPHAHHYEPILWWCKGCGDVYDP